MRMGRSFRILIIMVAVLWVIVAGIFSFLTGYAAYRRGNTQMALLIGGIFAAILWSPIYFLPVFLFTVRRSSEIEKRNANLDKEVLDSISRGAGWLHDPARGILNPDKPYLKYLLMRRHWKKYLLAFAVLALLMFIETAYRLLKNLHH